VQIPIFDAVEAGRTDRNSAREANAISWRQRTLSRAGLPDGPWSDRHLEHPKLFSIKLQSSISNVMSAALYLSGWSML